MDRGLKVSLCGQIVLGPILDRGFMVSECGHI